MRGKADPVTDSTPVALAHLNAFRAYKAIPLPGDACVILGSDASTSAEKDWSACIPDAFFEQMPCAFSEILREPGVKRLAAILRECAQEPGRRGVIRLPSKGFRGLESTSRRQLALRP